MKITRKSLRVFNVYRLTKKTCYGEQRRCALSGHLLSVTIIKRELFLRLIRELRSERNYVQPNEVEVFASVILYTNDKIDEETTKNYCIKQLLAILSIH